MQKGYITIAMTLVLLTVTIGVVSAMAFLSGGNAKISESAKKGEQAFYASDSCLEEGLLRLKADPLYAGGTVEFPNGTCHISLNEAGGTYTLQAYFSGEENYQRSIETKAQITDGVISLTDWSEKHLVVE